MGIAAAAPRAAWWQSGYAADCKSAYAGSNPAPGANSGPLSLLGAALFASGADMPPRAMPNETVELVDHVVAYQGRFRVGRYQFRHGRSEEHTSELQSHSDLVC